MGRSNGLEGRILENIEAPHKSPLLQPYCVRKIYGKPNVILDNTFHIRGAEADGKYIGTSDPFISIPFESITEVKVYRLN